MGGSDEEAGEERELTDEELVRNQRPDRVYSSRDYWDEKGSEPILNRRFNSLIPSLDNFTDGFETGEVWAISGPTKHGKTTFCDTIGRNFTLQGIPILWFSFEMTYQKFLAKYRELTAPVIYVPRERNKNNLKWIYRRVREAKLKYGCKVAFLDHLHFLIPVEQMFNNSQIAIGHAVRYIKTEIALGLNMCVFLVAHLRKLDFTLEPNENDMKDSASIAQDTDGTIIIYRKLKKNKKTWTDEDPFSNRAKLVICTARRTGIMHGKVDLIKVGDDLVEEEKAVAQEEGVPF